MDKPSEFGFAQYISRELVCFYDFSANGLDRSNAYLVGRDFFIKRNLSIDTYLNFIKWRGVLLFKQFILVLVTIIWLIFILFMAISNGAIAYALMTLILILSILGILGFLQSKFFLNYSQTNTC